MKLIKISFLIILICSSLSKNGHTQWILKSADKGGAVGVDAWGDKIAISSIFKTTDGGDSWIALPWVGEGTIASVSIVDSFKIWIATAEPGKIYSTTNGGLNWNLQFYDPTKTNFFNYIKMFDGNNGIAMGDAPTSDKPLLILRTTNGGLDWISMNDSFFIGGYSRHFWKYISFVSITTGYLQPYFPNQTQSLLYKTTDGGKTWISLNFTFPIVWCVKFYNESIGCVLTYDYNNIPSLHRTVNGGVTWETFSLPTLNVMPRDLEFVPGHPNKIWYTDYNKLFFSSDMGETWGEQFVSSVSLKANHIVFGDSLNGWLFCSDGKIYKTSNGDRLTSVDNGQIVKPSAYNLYQNYPNPFNSKTKIRFTIASTELNSTKGDVITTLKVYDLLGREIATLVNELKQAGEYEVEFDADKYNLSSGVYLYELRSGSFKSVKKFVLME